MVSDSDASRRRLWGRIATISTVVRQCASLTAAIVALLAPDRPGPANTIVMVAVAGWAIYRLSTRSLSTVAVAGDVALTFILGAATPVLTTVPELAATPSLSQTALAVSVATLGVQLSVPWSIAALLVGIGGYGWGTVVLSGWDVAFAVVEVLAIATGWAMGALLGLAIAQVARTADRAHRDWLAMEVVNGIAEARRNDDREQLALLHDTAAATLQLISQEAPVPAERLAAQASRDLAVLLAQPVPDSSGPVDVVRLLREEAALLGLNADLTGLDHLWLDPERANILRAAAREAMNNVDRHAAASAVTIYTGRRRIEISDDGCGIVGNPSSGHGIDGSIVARMQRIGGSSRIHSTPGLGTTVELLWPDDDLKGPQSADAGGNMVRHLRTWYGRALIATALGYLTLALLRAPSSISASEFQLGLAATVVACALAAAPRFLRGARWPTVVVTAALACITVMQKATLDLTELRTYADWSLGAVGFCLLPHLIRLRTASALTLLSTVWTASFLVDVVRDPSPAIVGYLGCGVAGLLIPQIAACLFNASVTDTLVATRRENHARQRLETKDSIATAMQSDCVRRYSGTVDRLVPLLQSLSSGDPITDELRRRARTECRQLRALFDESGSETTPLSRRIDSLIGQAEHRGVDVTAHLDDDLPALRLDALEHVLHQIDSALSHARSKARIVLTTALEAVDLSVVYDVSGASSGAPQQCGGGLDVVVADDTMWITLRAG